MERRIDSEEQIIQRGYEQMTKMYTAEKRKCSRQRLWYARWGFGLYIRNDGRSSKGVVVFGDVDADPPSAHTHHHTRVPRFAIYSLDNMPSFCWKVNPPN